MVSKLIITLLLSSFNSYLLKQDNTSIDLAEVDAFVHSIPNTVRNNYVANTSKFEKDIYTVLNVNLIYDYLKKEQLLDKVKTDQGIVENDFQDQLDQNFIEGLGYSEDEFNNILKQFDLKKQYALGFQHYLYNQVDDSVADEFAEEHYLLNVDKYISQKSMDLSQISLSKQQYNLDQVKEIQEYINSGDKTEFTEMATAYSTDPSVKSNQGNLGVFKQNQYVRKVGKKIFSINEKGFHNGIIEDGKNYYLIYVNDLTESEQIPFEQVKEDIKKSIKQNIADRKFENVMATISSKEVEVNIEQLASIQSRYITEEVSDNQSH